MFEPIDPHSTPDLLGLVARLARLRRQVSASFWVEGLARVLWLALAVAALDIAADWLFHLDRPQRAILLLLIGAALGWAVGRWLRTPLSIALSDDALALAIEAAHPRLGQGLITALQLARGTEPLNRGISRALVMQAVTTGCREAQEIRFASILDSQRQWRSALSLVSAAGAWFMLATAALYVPLLQIGLSRNVLLSKAAWPQQTYLVVERLDAAGALIVPRGGETSLVVSVTPDSRVVPPIVSLEFRGAGEKAPAPMQRASERRFSAKFSKLTQAFEFRARGGDATTEWVQFKLVDPPQVTRLAIIITPPDYAGGRPVELSPGLGPYAVLPGSSLELAVTANPTVRRAELAYEGELLVPPSSPNEVHEQASVELAALDATRFTGRIPSTALVAGHYHVELVDAFGFVSRPVTFVLSRRVDRPPQVQVRLRGFSGLVTPQARLPYVGRATDDFGVAAVRGAYRWNSSDTTHDVAQHEQFFTLGRDAPAGRSSVESIWPAEIELDDVLDLTPLKLAPGSGLSPRFEAVDNNDVTGPGVGRSAEFLLRVVTPAELRSDLMRRERQQQAELQAVLKGQVELLTQATALLAARQRLTPQSAGGLSADQTRQLTQDHRQQKSLGQRMAAAAERIADIAAEVRNNRLDDERGRLESRLTRDIAAPLQAIAGELVPRAAAALGAVRQQETPAASAEALAEVIRQQHRIREQLQEVLQRLALAEGFQDAVNLLYEIERAQTEVQQQTDRARAERARQLLEQNAARREQP